ncbi:hypothetical protein PIB30_088144 [Stylosanthes scabra]|uniref:Uncharacterized protein n=1 Tax=Stylosanthes scabra TaxID=79078 RepID=A0ABU6WUQ8_9FABA|nr:hypothetical protein [Stylosanthes scabra]
MKSTRNLPITALVKSTYYRLSELFYRKGLEARAQLQVGNEFSQWLLKAIKFNSKARGKQGVIEFCWGRGNVTVVISRHFTFLAAMYWLHAHMHDLTGKRMWTLCIVCSRYSMCIERSSAQLDMRMIGHPMMVFVLPNPRMIRARRGRRRSTSNCTSPESSDSETSVQRAS